jgi:hypothetical protein
MPRRIQLSIALAILLLAGIPLHAAEYEVHLKNGNIFNTRYLPVVAPFDSTRLLLMTSFGNPITLPRDQVGEVISLTEAFGFGKRLDDMTILIGLAANDNPTPEEQAALEAQAAQGIVPTPYSIPLESETEGTQGLPLQFLNFTTPPLGGGGFNGSPSDLRRGGGGTQFVEPQTRD